MNCVTYVAIFSLFVTCGCLNSAGRGLNSVTPNTKASPSSPPQQPPPAALNLTKFPLGIPISNENVTTTEPTSLNDIETTTNPTAATTTTSIIAPATSIPKLTIEEANPQSIITRFIFVAIVGFVVGGGLVFLFMNGCKNGGGPANEGNTSGTSQIVFCLFGGNNQINSPSTAETVPPADSKAAGGQPRNPDLPASNPGVSASVPSRPQNPGVSTSVPAQPQIPGVSTSVPVLPQNPGVSASVPAPPQNPAMSTSVRPPNPGAALSPSVRPPNTDVSSSNNAIPPPVLIEEMSQDNPDTDMPPALVNPEAGAPAIHPRSGDRCEEITERRCVLYQRHF